LIGESHPGTFNQAMMEFGSLHCTPKKPKCQACPFSKNCVALNQNKISALPVKTSRQK
jgi:A/G-specific adenine glycosylase